MAEGWYKMGQPLQKTVWSFLKYLNIEILYDPAIQLLSIYPKELKSESQRDFYTLTFIATLFTIGKTWKQPKCSWKD